MKRQKTNLKINNSGVALVMVIVVISFVSIVATILLYMAALNFYMKTSDIKTKESFYSGEEALEEIKASLMVDVSKAYQEAYRAVIPEYSKDADEMQEKFSNAFLVAFEKNWLKHTSGSVDTQPTSDQVVAYLDSVITKETDCSYSITFDLNGTGSVDGSDFSYSINKTDGKATICTMNYTFTDSKKYTTIISTDFAITVPRINFELDADVEDDEGYVSDLVACVNYENWTKR